MRIAYARIAQETHAFSPLPSTIDDFKRNHALEGEALGSGCHPLGTEVPGWTRFAELSGFVAACLREGRDIETVPLFSLWAVPSGPLTEDTFLSLRQRLQESLRAAMPLDAVYLSLHGAMRAQGAQPEPEDGFIEAVREVIGDIPLAVSYDLHGQMTPTKALSPNIVTAYHTNPHRDLFQTGWRSGRSLVQMVRGERKPTTTWRSLPMVLGGGSTIDIMAPMRGVFKRISEMEGRPGVLHVNLFMCHPWNDSPDLGWSVVVTTDNDPSLADQVADELADIAWKLRKIPTPEFVSPTQALDAIRAARLRRRLGTCCLCDASDVVGSGSTGESTHLLRALLNDATDLKTYATIRDAEFVARLWDAPIGARAAGLLGGKLDPELSPPLPVDGRVHARVHTKRFGRAIALDLDHVQVVVTELAPYTLKPSFYSDLNLDPWKADAVMVKSFFHFRIYYALINRLSFLVKTQGLTDFDIAKRVQFSRPVHPFSEVERWRA
jgi:microcystin degradation protein MlrC